MNDSKPEFNLNISFQPEEHRKIEARLSIDLPYGISAGYGSNTISGHPQFMLDLSRILAGAVAKFAPELLNRDVATSEPS